MLSAVACENGVPHFHYLAKVLPLILAILVNLVHCKGRQITGMRLRGGFTLALAGADSPENRVRA